METLTSKWIKSSDIMHFNALLVDRKFIQTGKTKNVIPEIYDDKMNQTIRKQHQLHGMFLKYVR